MSDETEIIFFASKSKARKHILYASTLLLFCVIFLLFTRGYYFNRVSNTSSAWAVFGIIASFFFLYKSIMRYNSKAPILTLNKMGILSELTPAAKAMGYIEWKDVTSFKKKEVQSVSSRTDKKLMVLDKVISVYVKNPEYYAAKIQNKALQNAVISTLDTTENESPIIHLPVSEIDCQLQDLLEILELQCLTYHSTPEDVYITTTDD